MGEQIKTEVTGNIAIIKMDRPECKNALTQQMYNAMTGAIIEAESNPHIRVIVITGTDECFTAGNDLNDFLNNPPIGENSPVTRFMMTLLECKKTVVAAINGAAVGIGATMLLHCDLVYAGPKTRLQMPFTRLGLCPEYASSLLLPQLIGHRNAFEILILGEPVYSEQALTLGLVNNVSDNYLEDALTKAEQLAKLPPAAVKLGKQLMLENERQKVIDVINIEIKAFSERLKSDEAKEAFSAFLGKREPDFSQFD